MERLGDGAGRQRGQDVPRRLRRGSRTPLGLGERAAGHRGLPRRLVARPLPDRDRAARRRRRRRGQPRPDLPVDRAATRRRVLPAEHPARRRAGVRRTADGRGRVPDRAGVPARPHRSGRLDARQEVGGLPGGERTLHRAGALGEHRRLLTGHHRRRDRRARLRSRDRLEQRRRRGADKYLATADNWQSRGRRRGPRRTPARTPRRRTTCGSAPRATPTSGRRSRSPTAGR